MKSFKRSSPISSAEWCRLQELVIYEKAARQKGYKNIAGIDEAGRGPLAGPVVAGICIIPEDVFLPGVNDSKKLSAAKREEVFELIVSNKNIHYATASVSQHEIDDYNIHQSSILSMVRALEQLEFKPDYLLIDGKKITSFKIPCECIIKGDAKSQSIAAASILAKVTRDKLMKDYHLQWPQYGFDKHKGYATAEHFEALRAFGPCPIHRFSFEPLKSNYKKSDFLQMA